MSRRQYYPELDGIRAIAALMVMWFHAVQTGMPFRGPGTLGQTGVDLFFVLSGFLITSILLSARQNDWSEVKTFYIRRSFRIFPLYYGFLLLNVALRWDVNWTFWVYLQNFWISGHHHAFGPGHFWSLAVEEQFYLVWPFLVLFTPRRHLVKMLWSIIAVAALFRLYFGLIGHDLTMNTLTRMDTLAFGALLAVFNSNGRLFEQRRKLAIGTAIFTVLMLCVGLAGRHSGELWFDVSRFWLVEGFYTCLIGIVITQQLPRFNALLRWRPLRFLGRISYGLYVFHPLAFAWIYYWFRNYSWWLRVPMGFGAAFLLAVFSWYAYERNFIHLKDRLAPERHFAPEAPVNI